MNIEEIKKTLKVNIKDKNRSELYVYLKCLYINQEYNKGKNYSQIAKELQIKSHASIINIFKNTEYYKQDKFFELIQNAYNLKDISYIKEYNKLNALRRKEYSKLHHEKSYAKTKVVEEEQKEFVYVKPKNVERPHILEVAKNLRFIKTDLNDKIYTKWSEKDFNKYYKIIKDEKQIH